MNPLYQQIMGRGVSQGGAPSSGPMNPMQKMFAVMQAMQNPAAYLKQRFPDIPDQIQNNPGQILSYLQKTRGISDQQVQQTEQQMNQIIGQGNVR